MTNVKDLTFYDVAKDDHSELEGKVITFISRDKEYTGVVVGCNRSVGVTIVNAKNKDEYLCCLVGPVAPGFKKFRDASVPATDTMDYLIQGIIDGEVSMDKAVEVYNAQLERNNISLPVVIQHASAEVCPYNQ